jgi:MoaA/NifB/PqqE/SkfB family radical SAM enzyme
MSIIAIDNYCRTENIVQIIWNMGIRCTYDCSYCPSFRHSLTKPFQTLEAHKNSINFLKEWIELHDQYLNPEYKRIYDINLTGGEPTAIPHLVEALSYLKEQIPIADITLTTNGFLSRDVLDILVKDFLCSVTFSYHAEASPSQKDIVLKNILKCKEYVKDDNYILTNFQVNLMMHEDPELFEDCQEVKKMLENENIRVLSRTIDRDDKVQSRGREQGSKIKNSSFGPKTGMKYTNEQLLKIQGIYEKDFNAKKELGYDGITDQKPTSTTPSENRVTINGRPCCGGRTLCTLDNETNEWTDTKIIYGRNFKGWNCLVNLQWLCLEQDDDEILTHQTCKATFNNSKGPVGKISEYKSYIDFLKSHLDKGQMPIIKCPNFRCGCGICTPKSTDEEIISKFFKRILPEVEPIF